MPDYRCPGQDKRFWKEDDIFEVPCPACGEKMEFFKDDGRRRCPHCGAQAVNPKVELGCAKWCAYAKDCIGYDPKKADADESVCDRIIAAVKKVFAGDQARIRHALRALNFADEILHAEKEASPVIVKAAATLHDIGIKQAEQKHGGAAAAHHGREGRGVARAIMEDIGMDAPVVDDACEIIAHHHDADAVDSIEFRIVWDADTLVNMEEGRYPTSGAEGERFVETTLRTPKGREIGRRLLRRVEKT